MLQELLIQLVMTLENSETKSLSRKNLIKLFDDCVVNKNPPGKPGGILFNKWIKKGTLVMTDSGYYQLDPKRTATFHTKLTTPSGQSFDFNRLTGEVAGVTEVTG